MKVFGCTIFTQKVHRIKEHVELLVFFMIKKEGDYLFSGENYDSTGALVYSFQVRDIQFDKNINGFRYWGTVKQYENASFSCYGELCFVETGDRLINSANGFFINNSKDFVRAKYCTERIYGEKLNPYILPHDLQTSKTRGEYAALKYSGRTNN